ALLVLRRNQTAHALPHQLPEEPPPPNDPPPPEKPPPEKPPSEKPPEPDDQDEPPGMIQEPLDPRERRDGGVDDAPLIMKKIKRMSAMTKIQVRSPPQSGAGSGRCSARAFHSASSPVRTSMMPSTPRPMPPAKSLALKRGMMAVWMMTFESASVSVPS